MGRRGEEGEVKSNGVMVASWAVVGRMGEGELPVSP